MSTWTGFPARTRRTPRPGAAPDSISARWRWAPLRSGRTTSAPVQALRRSSVSSAANSSTIGASRSSRRPSSPWRIARHMFSSISRAGRSGGVAPASTSSAARRTQATISSASASASVGRGLGVADPHLDGAEGVVRAHGPPQLRELDDRARADEQLDVLRPRRPAPERVGDAAARERLRERLRAAGVQAGVAAVDVGRVRAEGEQQRQHRPQPVADADGAVGALHADVDVHGERVVAPGDVLQAVLDAVVVLRVDDVLLAVVAERVRPGGAEGDALGAGEREQPAARLLLAGARVGDVASRRPSGSRSPRRSARPRSSPRARRRPRPRRGGPRSAGRAAASRGRSARTPPRARP